VFRSDALVIATGGLSYGKLGASGFGLEVAKQFGLKVVPPAPALVPFLFPGRAQAVFKELAGVSVDAALTCGGKRREGSILFTHRGLSGPAALQASLYWTPGEPLLIDLLPDTDILAVMMAKRRSRMELRTLLAGHLPKRLAEVWCGMLADPKPLDQTSDQELKQVAEGLHAWSVLPKGTEGYDTAEVTAGGVTGELGGYNLHWAWASGFAAGQVA
jgi:predicted Rossmann fold flavoprotein